MPVHHKPGREPFPSGDKVLRRKENFFERGFRMDHHGRKSVLYRLSIRAKLIGVVALSLLLIAAVLGATWLYYGRIARANALKQDVYAIAQKVLDARVAEKTYLQFNKPEYRDQLLAAVRDAGQAIHDVQGRVTDARISASLDTLARNVTEYQSLFEAVVSMLGRKGQLLSEMAGYEENASQKLLTVQRALDRKKYDLQMEGESLSGAEVELLASIRSGRLYFANLRALCQQYLLQATSREQEAYTQYLSNGIERNSVDAILRLGQTVGKVEDTDVPDLTAGFKQMLDAFTGAVEQAFSLLVQVKETVTRLDGLGLQVKEVSGSILAEATASVRSAQTAAMASILAFVVVGGLVYLVIVFLVVQSVLIPIRMTFERVRDIAQGEGDLTKRVAVLGRDEMSALALEVNRFLEKLQGIMQGIGGNAGALARSSEALLETSRQMAANTDQANAQSRVVSAAGEEMSTNIRTMADSADRISQAASGMSAAVEEMSVSVRDVAQNCARELQIAREADEKTRQAREMFIQFGEAAREIGKIVDLINGLSGQTNLLALNATIEAAGAGAAGKGFAVVANEIKALARQSSEATDRIRQQIENIQKSARAAIDMIGEIAAVIENVSSISGTIATAAEQQSTTAQSIAKSVADTTKVTGDLACNVKEAAAGSGEMSRSIQNVHAVIGQTAQGAGQTRTSAQELAGMAKSLQEAVGRFKV